MADLRDSPDAATTRVRQSGVNREKDIAVTVAQTEHRYLAELHNESARRPELVGGKAAGLARMVQAGFDVPDAVVLTTRAFTDALGSEPDREAVTATPLPSSVEQALLKVAKRFGSATLAVRSSGVAEDFEDASFAGQYETVLGVQGIESLVSAVRECWVSAFSSRLDDYRNKMSIGVHPVAVLIQQQIDPVAAGVVFTADPVTGDRETVVINAVAGLADRLMSGEITPEEWRITDTTERSSSPESVLTPDQAETIAELAHRVAAHEGTPQDVEWALDETRLWLLQARPITALPKEPVERVEPVPIPVDIPDGYWERLATHFPDPSSPLSRSVVYPIINAGTAGLGAEFGILLDGVVHAEIGGWTYLRMVPFGGKDRKPPPTWLAKVMVRLHPGMRKRVRAAIEAVRTDKSGRYIRRWYEEWMPDLARRAEELRDVDLSAVSDNDLLSHFERCVDLLDQGITTHFLRAFPAQMIGVYGLIETSREMLGWEPAKVLELLRGLSQRSTEPGRRLASLARMATERPQVKTLLEHIDQKTASQLDEVDSEFAAEFEKYRQEYGVAALSRDIKDPSMGERPELLLRLIANQLATGFDPSKTERGNEEERSRILTEARTALAERPPEDRDRFEEALSRAERAYPIREDNLFYTLFTPAGLLRRAALEVGSRLAERKQIRRTSDVFFLEKDELIDAFTSGEDQRELVTRRKGELAWALDRPGPASYGQAPGEPPPLDFLPSEARHTMEALLTIIELTIGPNQKEVSDEKGLRGIPASAGKYTGPVRVINTEHEFDKLQAGDVLVCPMTSPAWSVLFPSVGALITDSGGILNHPAIIAREYRIPAVVATADATTRLRDGQMVTVDGASGTVELEPDGQ